MSGEQRRRPARLRMIAPQFVVPDVVRAAEFYRDVLGFRLLSYWQDPPVYAIVARDAVEIHFGKGDTGAPGGNRRQRAGGLDAYIFVDGVDALFEDLRRRQADLLTPEGPTEMAYGQREIVVRDCNGFVLAFGEDLTGTAPPLP